MRAPWSWLKPRIRTLRLTVNEAGRVNRHSISGTVALTFDDGPDRIWTTRVLAELERHAAVATFFVDASRAVAHRDLIEIMREAGHEVGLHCFDHVRHSKMSESAVATDTARALSALESIGVRPTAWRAPWGDVTAATCTVAAAHELTLWGWNFDTHDWRGDSSTEMLAALAASGGLRDGAVVLMHDGIGPGARRTDCVQTVRLASVLLEVARAQGLRPTTVSSPQVASQ